MISFEEFEKCMHAIEDHDDFCHRVSKFLEDEICKGSWCMVTAGEKLKQLIIKNLCKEFDIEYDNCRYGNEIEWWLYEDVNKIYYVGDTEVDVGTLRKFYDYLVEDKKRREKLSCDT